MAYLVAIAVPLVLLALFLALTVVERRRGVRVLSGMRASLDATASGIAAQTRTLEPLAALMGGARTLAGHILHDIATVALAAVRAVERALAGKVRHLRSQGAPVRTETRSGFLKSVSYFKRSLRGPEKPADETPSENTVG